MTTKIPLTEQGDTIIVQQSGAEPIGVIVTLHDSRGKGTSNVDIAPAEWDAFVVAGNAVLGRPAPVATPLEERIAEAAKEAHNEGASRAYYREGQQRSYGRSDGLKEALAMVREAGPTVPRAAVEALRDTILGWEKAALPGSYEDGRAQGLLDVVAVIDTMLGTKEPDHADD